MFLLRTRKRQGSDAIEVRALDVQLLAGHGDLAVEALETTDSLGAADLEVQVATAALVRDWQVTVKPKVPAGA